MTIGESIQEYRKKKGLTQKDLAEKVGVATGTIQQYELNKRSPRLDIMKKISEVIDLPYVVHRIGAKTLILPTENIDVENIQDMVDFLKPTWSPTTEDERRKLEMESDRILLNKIKSLSDTQQAALNVIIEGLFNNNRQPAPPDPDHQ